jgi:hypothetical protein
MKSPTKALTLAKVVISSVCFSVDIIIYASSLSIMTESYISLVKMPHPFIDVSICEIVFAKPMSEPIFESSMISATIMVVF